MPRTVSPPRTATAPDLRVETGLLGAGERLVAGCDEVGRGALAGPVTVGVVVVDPAVAVLLEGPRDSKLLTAAAREALVEPIREWSLGWGVGHASPGEIDDVGLSAAVGLAGRRALEAASAVHRPDVVLVDGNYDWLSPKPQTSLFEAALTVAPEGADPGRAFPRVSTRIKADLACLSVAAASVLAKVERDRLMVQYHRDEPHFCWAENKGYGTEAHRAALREHGPSPRHRRSWRLV
ncbi:ribonuclease HII [Zhihengliuella sp.]|uniref:ribonuclease HII n=1 Tax=Zhihengliuella sp. TaxID=1954483 RepID=UPI002810DCFA|nr:ribonuclease HII [Zhihengliuella sp.]